MTNSIIENIQTCIIIPCYNEEKGLPLNEYKQFLNNNKNDIICFVNDGSKDKTLKILQDLNHEFPSKTLVISYKKNKGKAEAVRTGVRQCLTTINFKYLAYLDADLATSLEECATMNCYFKDSVQFVFGSRIKRLGAHIERKRSRFLIGRIIATAISIILKLPVYDTQCGCKLFSKETAQVAFKEKFISKWLFDVEIFKRIIKKFGHNQAKLIMLEVPLNSWVEKGDSKVKATYFFKLWIDLYKIYRLN